MNGVFVFSTRDNRCFVFHIYIYINFVDNLKQKTGEIHTMNILNSHIESFYNRPNLYNEIINRLKEMDVDLSNIRRKDIAGVDEFHVRGAQVSRELAEIANIKNAKVLDIGCGIGGPCRMLADEFGCNTIGIDLSGEYVATANLLSKLVGLEHVSKFVQGDALKLPFPDSTFDGVWTQHVQMNVRDKLKFYSEVERVLNDKGVFIYYEVFKKDNLDVRYPMPWADDGKISFLEPSSNMNSIFENLGLIKEKSMDQTESGIKILEKSLNRTPKDKLPRLGLNVLMGDSTKGKMTNLLNGLKEGKIHLESGIYKRRKC